MNSPKNFLRFIPLSTTSANNVLYYDSEAPSDSIHEAIDFRLLLSHRLLSSAQKAKDIPELLFAAIIASSVFIDEASTLLQELDPVVLQLRREEELRQRKFLKVDSK